MGAMKGVDDIPSPNPSDAQGQRQQQPQHRLSTARSSKSYGSYEIGESSTSTSFDDPTATTTALSHPRRDVDKPSSNPYAPEQGSRDLNHEIHKRRRSHKPRSSGGFLLANTVLDEPHKVTSTSHDDGRRRSRIPVDSRKGKFPINTSDRSNTTAFPQTGLGIEIQDMERSNDTQISRVLSPAPETERRHSSGGRGTSKIPTASRPSTAPLDIDSTQIVNMALSLGESRRMSTRRNISTPIPPRLAQLPDHLAGGGLKQHLQQQRRTSRNISPRPEKGLTPRVVSTPRIASPLQSSFNHDEGYQYQFSSSTLNRAQKAKEYLELMTQYRRLLQFVPPLKQDARSRPSSSGLSTSPTNSTAPLNPLTGAPQVTLGRPYNPLQYIRNRKVRARERKAIDGSAQGFSDVSRVTGWIDETAQTAALSGVLPGTSLILPFPGAHEKTDQDLPASNIPRPISTVAKPKRLRIDWSIDPADMIADTYWLEQGDNKYLIEDRHYSKIFPRKAEVPISTPYSTNEPVLSAVSTSSTKEGDATGDTVVGSEASQISPARIDSELSLPSSARDRARQKIQDFRGGMHHKQNGLSHGHHDFLRFRKGSLSDTSDSEADRKKRNRNGTISANGRDLLEKQMMEMLAKENEEQKAEPGEHDRGLYLKDLPSRMVVPEKNSQSPEQLDSRKESRVEIVENLDKATRERVLQGSPMGSGRPSLEVVGHIYRVSTDLDSSRPESPAIRPSRGLDAYLPTIGMDLSPPTSRPASPGRKPFSRVKSIFRDRSKERERDRERGMDLVREREDKTESPIEPSEPLSLSAVVTAEGAPSPDERRSKSLTRKIITRSTNESHKSHRSVGSLKLRGEEQVGLRSIFKGGAKIDGMIRGGVSKVTDLLWKRDLEGESSSSSSSSDESDGDSKRGRIRESITLSRSSSRKRRDGNRQKNYLDVMPPFKSASIATEKPVSGETDFPALTHTTSPPSRSPRFDRLKPPRIDIRKASPPSAELERTRSRQLRESDVSDTESRSRVSSAHFDSSRRTSEDLNEILSLPPRTRPRIGSRTLSQGARHWSISERSPSGQFATQISRREVARLRALILCSGIKAMEISRRAHEPHPLFALDNKATGLPWPDIGRFVAADDEHASLAVPQTRLFPAAARILSESIERSVRASEQSTARFASHTTPRLHRRVEGLHARVGGDLMELTHRAADEADEVGRDLMDGQRLKVKRVVDTMDKMLRRRRRRFRWARRAGWLAVEWVLVGFMWYVWFVVTVARVVLGLGRGVVGVVRWLLWL
ncbi:hypothetical protein F4821DRAFT_191095 [Hypoxylon rubiginosum]|uniref:Uncharacterized protein n=1 Tax=Hypoxylon rubiginosum TaxID=110542 RepID=A0ACC0CSZ5_9PEZI|nr:hypothetical protein F4821DRAFT_191095 [Hypoxylon rubiginosum]